MSILKYTKELGIITSYLLMLIATYLLDWEPFGIFISYLIEIVILLVFYALNRMKDERRNPKRYRNSQPLINVFIGIVPIVLFQYFIIVLMANELNNEQDFLKQNLFSNYQVYFAIGAMFFFYRLKQEQISKSQERIRVFQNNFMFQVLALTSTNLLGFILVFSIGVNSLLFVLSIMVTIRIILEIYFGRKTLII